MGVVDRDLGWNAIKAELKRAQGKEVAVGILAGAIDADGTPIAEYATYNEYGTDKIPSRPFMAMSFDENKAEIEADFRRETVALTGGKRTIEQSLTVVGQKHADRVKNTIADRDILPALSPRTVAAKKGSTKTLVDTGAMVNAVQISVRNKT